MGSGASSEEPVSVGNRDPMSQSITSGAHPRSRGPRNFDEVPNVNVAPLGQSSQMTAPPTYGQSSQMTASSTYGQAVAGSSSQSQHQPGPSSSSHTHYEDEDIAFESFYNENGEVYTCVSRRDARFYMKEDGSYVPFPAVWYNHGILVTDQIVKAGSDPGLTKAILAQMSRSQSVEEHTPHMQYRTGLVESDRDGWLFHPSKGNVYTYVFEETRNIHCFFDEMSGHWVKLPISLELQSNLVAGFISQVQHYLPGVTDKRDILAALRVSNYDVQDCVRNWHLIGDQGSLVVLTNPADQRLLQAKDRKIQDLELQLKKSKSETVQVTQKLTVITSYYESAVARISGLEDKIAEQLVTMRTSQIQAESLSHSRAITQRQPSGRSRVDRTALESLSHNASLVHQSYSRLKMDIENGFADCNKILKTAVEAAFKLPKQAMMVSADELKEVRVLYRKECLQRKLLYNKLQELRGNIRVYARCRKDSSAKCILDFPTDEDIELADVRGNRQRFRFDRVYTPESTQEQVFEETRPIVTSCVDGYNVCILAYGQTGSGKTFTMMGPVTNPGVNIRAIQELLQITDERKNTKYQLTVSMVEIYNEAIQDLLTEDCKTVNVQQVGAIVNFQGLSYHSVKTKNDISELMNMGMTNRTVASTKMNSESSRSHLLVMLTVEGHDLTSNARTKGTLTLVDLAGSERISKTEVSGQQLLEATAINKSLSALGQVFAALGKSALHIPFRNSKLTQVLQPSLSGDAKAALFVALSPAESNLSETMSTLTFGSNAKQIELGCPKKNATKGKPAV